MIMMSCCRGGGDLLNAFVNYGMAVSFAVLWPGRLSNNWWLVIVDDHINCGLGHAAAPPAPVPLECRPKCESLCWSQNNMRACIAKASQCHCQSVDGSGAVNGAEFSSGLWTEGETERKRDTAIQLCPWGGNKRECFATELWRRLLKLCW